VDVPRQTNKRRRTLTRTLYGVGGVTVLAGITLGLSHLKPAAPSVSRATVLVDTVKRGPMVRQVRGLGTLVPEEIRWIPAATEGRVEQIPARGACETLEQPDEVELGGLRRRDLLRGHGGAHHVAEDDGEIARGQHADSLSVARAPRATSRPPARLHVHHCGDKTPQYQTYSH